VLLLQVLSSFSGARTTSYRCSAGRIAFEKNLHHDETLTFSSHFRPVEVDPKYRVVARTVRHLFQNDGPDSRASMKKKVGKYESVQTTFKIRIKPHLFESIL
jgi:hypothetical protein